MSFECLFYVQLYALYDFVIAMIPCCLILDDRVSHARVSYMRLGLALFCLKVDMYVFRDE